MYCFSAVLYSEKDQFVKSNTEKFRAYRNRKRRKLHAYFKTDEKTTLAQQGRYLLICLLSMLLLFLAGSVLILNRTQQQVYEQLEEISKLYTDELDHRFFESAETCSRP